MLTINPAEQRGPTDAGWLKSQHSFSFGEYYNPAMMGFGPLRVINEDRVRGGAGFGTHSHANMEIISYVLDGGLAHKDNIGNGSTIRPGDIQLMSAGSGIAHSEFNGSANEQVHFLQMWVMPNVQNGAPSYQQKTFAPDSLQDNLRLVISPDGAEGSLVIKQDARMYAGRLRTGAQVDLTTNPNRRYWLQMAKGSATVNALNLKAGDGLAVQSETALNITAVSDAEIVLFDLP